MSSMLSFQYVWPIKKAVCTSSIYSFITLIRPDHNLLTFHWYFKTTSSILVNLQAVAGSKKLISGTFICNYYIQLLSQCGRCGYCTERQSVASDGKGNTLSCPLVKWASKVTMYIDICTCPARKSTRPGLPNGSFFFKPSCQESICYFGLEKEPTVNFLGCFK